MTKKILSLILVVCVFYSTCTLSVFADDDAYKTSRIAYFKANATETDSLIAGEEITAKVRVKGASVDDGFAFMLILYKDDMLEDIALGTKSAVENSSAVEYSAKLTIPSDIEGCELNTVLWDNLKDMNAICSSSLFPSDSTEILSLTVNGEEMLGAFDEDKKLSYNIAVGETVMPEIKVKTLDKATKVKISDPTSYPGSAEVVITSADGTKEDVYSISYVQNHPSLIGDKTEVTVSDLGGFSAVENGVVTPNGSYNGFQLNLSGIVNETNANFPTDAGGRYSVGDVYVKFLSDEIEKVTSVSLLHFANWTTTFQTPNLKNDGKEHRLTIVLDTYTHSSYFFVDGLLKSVAYNVDPGRDQYKRNWHRLDFMFKSVNDVVKEPFMKILGGEAGFYDANLNLAELGLYGAAAEYNAQAGEYEINHELANIRNAKAGVHYLGADNNVIIKGFAEGSEKFSEKTGYKADNDNGQNVTVNASSDTECDEVKLSIFETSSATEPVIELDVRLKAAGYEPKGENPDADLEF